jgi:hypothetical protein
MAAVNIVAPDGVTQLADSTGIKVQGISSSGNSGAKGSKVVTTPTIGATSTLLLAANAARISAILTNPKTATQTLHLGVSGVTTSTYSLALEPGQSYIDDGTKDAWYGCMASGSQAVNVTEIAP